MTGARVVPASAAVPPVSNPTIADSCGVDLTVVLDASGSVSSSGAVEDVRSAGEALLESLSNTNSRARVTQFATIAQQLAPSRLIDSASLAAGGVHRTALNGYYNPIPPRPSGVNIYSYNSGNPLSSSSYGLSNSSNQYTNWDQSLDQAGDGAPPDLVVYVTDGDPTAFDFNQAGDPFDPGPPPDVAVRTDRSAQAQEVTVDRAIQEANQIKTAGTRMLAIGVGSALSNTASRNRLVQIAGPQVVRDAGLDDVDSLNDIDVALVTDFEDLAQFMRSVVLQLCSPSLTVRKLAQTADDASYTPAEDWNVTVTPRVPGGDFNWILPDTADADEKTVSTDSNGFAQFQWEPDPPELDSAATVAEDLEPGFIAGRPGTDDEETDYRCALRDEDGNVRVEEGEFADPANPSFDLDPIGQEIVTCTLYNSFDYAPDIELAKVNSPTEVRGDLTPPAEVTSTYTATNPGNTPLDNVQVTDDRCGPVTPVQAGGRNVGDIAPPNGLLDPGESWQFTCTRTITTPLSRAAGGTSRVNTATVTGTDPAGTTVTDTATDDVTVFTPAITVTKFVNGEDDLAVVPVGAPVTYTYRVANAGNTPLGSVELEDDTTPCENPIRGPDDPGNDDATLGLTEVWTYSCATTGSADVINTAEVTGVPLNPLDADNPFPDPPGNPPVTDSDIAEVQVVNPDISLTKSAAPEVVLLDPGMNPPAEVVTYTFTAENSGDEPLNRLGGQSATDPGWVTDSRCTADATYVSGDDDGDELLDPDEVWTFRCQGQVSAPTVNVAEIEGQPSDDNGDPLPGIDPVSDRAAAFVNVVRPGITVTKTALRAVVLDPDAIPIAGPDDPTPRPAQYLYEVVNTGNVPLSLADEPPADDICSPVTFQSGDDDSDGLLGVEEVWEYSCETTLERQQGNTPPLPPGGDISGVVQNEVTVTGVPFFDDELVPDKSVDATDTAQVQVIEPGLTLTKTASSSGVVAGEDVTYTVVVANTGDVGLEPIGPQDSKCNPLVYVSGDSDRNGLINGANAGAQESWTYECTRPIGLPEPPATADENTATVLAFDPLGNLYEADDIAEVRAIAPAIQLTKTVSDNLVPAGTTVDYDFTVTNAGASPIVADDVLEDVALGDVADPENPACRTPTLVAKEGGDQDELLERVPLETWRYACQGTITEPTTNVAAVVGIGGSTIDRRIRVFDFDTAFVDAFHPGIEVDKTAEPTVLLDGGDVTYTYRVRNTGDVPLSNVADRIVDDTCSPVTYVSGDTDGDGLLDTPDSIFEDHLDETWLFTCTTSIDQTTTNTAVVEGTPTDPDGQPLCESTSGDNGAANVTVAQALSTCDATDDDRETVRVVVPGTIVVTKSTDPASSDTFDFTLGDQEFSLSDGGSRTFSGLAPGSRRLTELASSGWQFHALTCQDATDDTEIDPDEGTAVIELAEGETVTCAYTNVADSEQPNEPGKPNEPSGMETLGETGAPRWTNLLITLGVLLALSGAGLMICARHRPIG